MLNICTPPFFVRVLLTFPSVIFIMYMFYVFSWSYGFVWWTVIGSLPIALLTAIAIRWTSTIGAGMKECESAALKAECGEDVVGHGPWRMVAIDSGLRVRPEVVEPKTQPSRGT